MRALRLGGTVYVGEDERPCLLVEAGTPDLCVWVDPRTGEVLGGDDCDVWADGFADVDPGEAERRLAPELAALRGALGVWAQVDPDEYVRERARVRREQAAAGVACATGWALA